MGSGSLCAGVHQGQAEEGTTLTSQIEACLGQAEKEGYRVLEHLRLEEDRTGMVLDRPQKRLESLGKEHQRLVRLYRYGEIDDSYIERELQRLARERDRLTTEKKALGEKLAERAVTRDDIQAVREYCQRVAKNLAALSFEEKRLALEALQVKVSVEPDRLVLDGALPLSVASTHSGEGARG